MGSFLSLKLTLGALNALAVVVVAAVTLGIALSTSLDALHDIGERHARVLTAVARTETERLFEHGSDVTSAMLNLTQSQDWVVPSSNADPIAGNVTLFSFLYAMQAGFMRGQPAIDSLSLFLADGSDLNIAVVPENRTLYRVQFSVPSHPFDAATDNASTHLVQLWRKLAPLSTNVIATPDWERDGGLISSSRSNVLWGQLAQGTFGAFAPVIFTPRSLIESDGRITRLTGSAAPIYFPSVPARTAEYVSGYFVATISLDGIAEFLRNAKSTPGTEAFAYDSLGYMLAATASAPTFELRPDSTNVPTGCTSTSEFAVATSDPSSFRLVCQLRVADYGSSDLQAVASSGDAEALLFPAAGAQPVASLTLPDGGRTFVASAKVQVAFRGLEVFLMLLMPEADVLGDVISGRNVAIGVTCGLVVLFTVLNVCVTMLLLGPLTGIATRMHRAARFNDDDADTAVSAMAEVAELQRAYYAMNAELNYISSFVPQSVLEARKAELGEISGGGDDDGSGNINDEDDPDYDPDMASISGLDASASMSHAPHSGRGNAHTSPTSFNNSASNNDIDDDALAASCDAARSSTPTSPSSRSTAQPTPRMHASQRGGSSAKGSFVATKSASAAATLTMRNITVVCGNVVGLHAAAGDNTARTATTVAEELAAFVTLTESVVRAQQGVVTFHGDRFLATFNAARPCATHATKAAVTALGVALPDPDASVAALSCLSASCGVATGRCAVGSVGSATLKTMSAVGPAVTQAAVLERYAHAVSTSDSVSGRRSVAMATQRTVSEMAGAPVVARTMDLVNLPSWTPTASTTPTCVAELLRPISKQAAGKHHSPTNNNNNTNGGAGGDDGEWLYVIGDSSEDPRCVCNGVFALLASGDFADAAAACEALSCDAAAAPPTAAARRMVAAATTAASPASARHELIKSLAWTPNGEIANRLAK